MTLRTRFFALTYDRQMAKVEQAGLHGMRERLLAGAADRVLEVGAGTGLNLPFYGPAAESLTMTEPEIPMLRPGGRLLFIEHVRATDPGLARFQDRMNGLNRFLVGCDCNRPTLGSIQRAGFTVTHLEHATMPKAPAFVRTGIVGSATAPAGRPTGRGRAAAETRA